ncbi:hypothetical protein QYF36_005883 [Acer negundo]|nr:hypothetical protein QYF36_005883 [Acer negundo]
MRNVVVGNMGGYNNIQSRQSHARVVKESVGRYGHQDQFQEANMRIQNQGTKQEKVHQNAKMKKNVEIMNWDDNMCDSSWLEYSVVGVLKSFFDISAVIKDLLKRQIFFTFYYLGDKNVLWLFKSLKDREFFMKERVLWKDYFSYVSAWSPSITPQASVAWVEFRGIPLDCWCEDLFKRLGWAVGETLLIEEETLDRSTLANVRVPMLILNGQLCHDVVKVVSRNRTFNVTVREDLESIKYKMLLNWLGLYWDESDCETSSDKAVDKVDRCGDSNFEQQDQEMGGKPVSDQVEPQKNYGEKAKSNDKGKYVSDWYVEETDASVSSKAIMECGDQLKNIGGGINEVNDKVALATNKGDCSNFSYEDFNLSKKLNTYLVYWESINEGLGEVLGWNIIIDLGCGLVQENRQLSRLSLNMVNRSTSKETGSTSSNKTQSNNVLH